MNIDTITFNKQETAANCVEKGGEMRIEKSRWI